LVDHFAFQILYESIFSHRLHATNVLYIFEYRCVGGFEKNLSIGMFLETN